MTYDFDQTIDMRAADGYKYSRHDDDVLPMWVADMDFRSPEPVIEALQERAAHGVFGYGGQEEELGAILVERMADLYSWDVEAEQIHFVPGMVSAFNLVARTVGESGDGILLNTPAYFPFFQAIDNARRTQDRAPLGYALNDGNIRYEIDFDALEAAVTPRTRLFMLCNPHNPVGRVYTRQELEQIAEFCTLHRLVICSDEAHADLVLDGEHIPIASLAPEVAERTITLGAPSKGFNLPGLSCGFMIVQNTVLAEQLMVVSERIVSHVNVMGFAGAVAAYRDGGPWLEALLPYLRDNRDTLLDYVAENLPGVKTTCPEGTYLAWLDCRALGLSPGPFTFFLEEARVALVDGALFGEDGRGFVRLNFACPRVTLMEGLERMQAALDGVS